MPVPLDQLDGPPVGVCDFCSAADPRWIYTCDRFEQEHFNELRRYIDASDYRDRNRAARVRRSEGEYDFVTISDEGWAACEDCAELIEKEDVVKLVTRVTQKMPAKFTRGKRLLKVRGTLYTAYEHFFQTKRAGRDEIQA